MNTLIKHIDFTLETEQAKQINQLKNIRAEIMPQDNINMNENNLIILVVEDVILNQKIAKTLLEGIGYKVDIASTGKEALDFHRKNDYSAILMDIGLPDIPGLDVTREIRKLEDENTNNRRVPIIACTSNGLEAKNDCLSSGMDDFSGKPFDIENLDKMIKHWVAKYSGMAD